MKQVTKIVKRATVLDYEVLLHNRDFVDFFVGTTPRQYSDLINLGVSENKLMLIPNPTNLDEKEERQRDDIKLGFIGRISHPSKGVLFIPRIFSAVKRKNKSVKLKYLGGGQDLKVLKMMHFFDTLAGRVEFTGRFDIQELPKLASDIDIFLMPSKSEGFGIALIEAMAIGIVPIVTKIEGVTDWIVEDGVSGFVVERKGKHFVEKAEHLINDPVKRVQMAHAARTRVAELFTIEIVSKQYSTLFSKVIDLPKKETENLIHQQLNVLAISGKKKKLKFVPDFVKDIYKIINIKRQSF